MTQTAAVDFQDHSIRGLGRVNVLLGKNGSGKSTVLKALERFATDASDPWSETKYITPERAGVLVFDANVDQQIAGSPNWMGEVRRENQYIQFKQQTISQYRQLQLSVLLAVEASAKAKQEPKMFFSDYLQRINDLLDNIEIRSESTDGSFKMYDRESGEEIRPKDISSGESELIALAIEALVSSKL